MSQRLKLSMLATGFAIAAATIATAARADEGMWTFDQFPAERMRAAYGWAPDQAWFDHVRGAAVRINGCSASFVSTGGLILTNHHCAIACLQQLSSADNDLVAHGFNALAASDERRCPGQQAEVVSAITDVTARINAAIGTATGAALVRARDAEMEKLEGPECADHAKYRCQVVTLYGGGQYKLYRYRRYTDVRLVWAPEFQAAFFGGDPDNFNFPRYALDASFLRAYEDGRPAVIASPLTWSARAPVADEITFVAGNPGSTSRQLTDAQRDFQRQMRLPLSLILMSELRGRIIAAMAGNAERTREGADLLFGIENSFKAQMGQFGALNDSEFAAMLRASEADLRARAANDAALGDPWADIGRADAAYRQFYLDYRFLEAGAGQGSDLYGYARTLVRAAAEREKPSAERLPGYADADLPRTERRVLEEVPIYPWLEELNLGFWLSKTREYLTADSADVRALLGNESPEGLAARLISGTRLGDPAYRRQLWEGGAAAIAASDDPLIVLVRNNDARGRALRARFEAEYEGPVVAAQSRLAAARFAAYGASNYPDATFTLRLSYGRVAGWNERGRDVPFATHMGGTFDRATGNVPFDLASGFAANRARINPDVVYDFTTTNDIIGGNSGSPVIDRSGAVIGAAFDGNIHSLGGNFGYDGRVNRTVVVSTMAIQHALEVIYPAPRIVAELNPQPRRGRR
ncbi:MAG: S46 family peptidase [Sphingomonadaceae bacterium]|nr:S46 family peptidase [Sphingomonadaceae bacterium]